MLKARTPIGRRMAAKTARAPIGFHRSASPAPLRTASLIASSACVIGSKDEARWSHAGRLFTGKRTPPRRVLTPPKIQPAGSPFLKTMIHAADSIPIAVKHAVESARVKSAAGRLALPRATPKKRVPRIRYAPTRAAANRKGNSVEEKMMVVAAVGV